MSERRWFLPETPDVLGLLSRQMGVTIEGIDLFARWAAKEAGTADAVREAEHRGDAAKWELLEALREAFVTPLEPEDLFALSRSIDWILNYARDLINESEVMRTPPDAGTAEMAGHIRAAVHHLGEAVARLGPDGGDATESARAAIMAERQMEHAYYRGMAALLEVETTRERISWREMYRRCSRIGETVVDVAERVIYAVVKMS